MLSGTLDDFTLADIFRLLSWAKRTGSLQVERRAGTGRVLFRSGEVYYAESSLAREPLGQKLIRAGALTEGQLRRALDEHAANGKRVGQILVEKGDVTQAQLEAAVRSQIEDSVFDLLSWETGEFTWEPDYEIDVEMPIFVSVENLIMEASRRLDELEVIRRKIRDRDVVPVMAPAPPAGAIEINITPEEWRLLVLIDGRRSVGDIAQMVGMDDFKAMRTLYGLISAGLVETPGSEIVHDEAEPAPASRAQAVSATRAEPRPRSAEPAPEARRPARPEPEISAWFAPAPPPQRAAPQPAAQPPAPEPARPEPLYDEPGPDEPVVEYRPAPEPEAAAPEPPPEPQPAPRAEPQAPERHDPQVDRTAVVRELAGLFDDDARPRPKRVTPPAQSAQPAAPQSAAPAPAPEPVAAAPAPAPAAAEPGTEAEQGQRHRLEDDDAVTRGLISRLIDGVKGL